MSNGIKVFCSYSHKDIEFLNLLRGHLAVLERQGLIMTWNDELLVPRARIEKAIAQQLESCDLFVFLVSSDFLSSYFCIEKELANALERNDEGSLTVVPIIVRPCDWRESEFAHLLALPKDGIAVTTWPDRDSAMHNVVEGLRRTIRQMHSGIWAAGRSSSFGKGSLVANPERKRPLDKTNESKSSGQVVPHVTHSAIDILRRELNSLGIDYSVHSSMEYFADVKLRARSLVVSGMFNPRLWEFNDANGFWMSLQNINGAKEEKKSGIKLENLIGLQAFRLDVVETNLREWGAHVAEKSALFDLPTSILSGTADYESLAADVSGKCCYHGEIWIDVSVRNRRIFELFAKAGLLEAYRTFEPVVVWGLASQQMAVHGHFTRIGYSYAERGFLKWQLAPDGIDPVEYLFLLKDRDMRRLSREICEDDITRNRVNQ